MAIHFVKPAARAGALSFLFLVLTAVAGGAAEIAAFPTANQSPLVQIFGLPRAGTAAVLPAGRYAFTVVEDVASNFAHDETSQEKILLDGESYRTVLSLSRGIGSDLELGLELPFVGHSSGVFDDFIEGWHDTFSLPQGGRQSSAGNRLLYRYEKDGTVRLLLDESGYGLGDIRLTGGWQLYRGTGGTARHALALRGSLKLPTGSSAWLRGSGSTDIALWLSGSSSFTLPGPWGELGFYGAGGGMVMTRGDVLPDQQRHAAGFGAAGFGYAPADWITLKLQLDGHTPMYGDSGLRELSNPALEIRMGGDINFSASTALSIAVSEDLAVFTAPDVTLHLSLSHRF